MSTTLLFLLALSPAERLPDLHVEAGTMSGVDLPELAEALAHALVASGARVVLGGPVNDPCTRCARVVVVDMGGGHCRVDVTQNQHTSSVGLTFDAETTLFERVRAIAIQARLLVTWESMPEAKRKEPRNRAEGHSPEARADSDAAAGAEKSGEVVAAPGEGDRREPARGEEGVARSPLATRAPATGSVETVEAQPDARKPALVLLPDPEVVAQSSEAGSPRWPWLPTAIGASAAVAAGLCLLMAKRRYDAMADKSRLHVEIIEFQNEGEAWQTAAIVTSSVAVIGLTTGILGFVTAGSRKTTITPTATVLSGGGIVALTGTLP
ncbi:MAG TPA: hypothetical protein VF524_05235 [Polyangia bacterium]